MTAPTVRFRIDLANNACLGAGKIGLLEAIRNCGSLSQAARSMGMSYRYSWLLVESLKQSFAQPVTVAVAGGKAGGGMRVTAFGEALIAAYHALEEDFASLAAKQLRLLLPPADAKPIIDPKNALRPKSAKPRAGAGRR